ncbi:MAG: DUF4956 domain-containing protein [Bacteroidota bacterium]
MFEDFQEIALFRPSLFDIGLNMLVALLCGLIISLVYRLVYKGPSYSTTFVNSLVLLSVITAVVILVIGNNLARAFGLVGAMSIIRFRTAVRDVQDIVFIFFALSVGMAAGVGLPGLAIMATLLISAVIILLVVTNFSNPAQRKHLLQISFKAEENAEKKILQIVRQYGRGVKLINIKNIGPDQLEAFYQLRLKNQRKNQDFIQALQALDVTQQVNLFFDEDQQNSTAAF